MSVSAELTAYVDLMETLGPLASEAIKRTIRVGSGTAVTLSDGTGSYQATKIWTYRESLASTSRTWDLRALPLQAVAGSGYTGTPTLAFSKVKLVALLNEGTDGQIIKLGGAAADPWYPWIDTSTAKLIVMPGLPCLLPNLLEQTGNPWTVDGTHYGLKVDSPSATVAYTIALLGI